MAYNPAKYDVFNQIHLADTSGIMSGWDRTEVYTPDMANVSHIANSRDFKPNLLCEVGYWSLLGQREWSRLKQ
jgi:hypothetical protein